MGKTSMSAGTESRATAKYKVKKLTPRRITMIKDFLTKTIDSPDNFGESFGSEAWMDMLIGFLREPKRCRSTKMDILAWLKDDRFKELTGQVIRSAAKRTEPMSGSGTMEQSIDQVKLDPTSYGEDPEMQTLLPLCAIKTEIVAVEDDVEDQEGFEHVGQAATGNQEQEENWGIAAIQQEAEMVTVKEELMLDDEFDEKLTSVKSENQDPKEEILVAELDKDLWLDLSCNRSAVAFRDGMLESELTDQVMEPEEPVGNPAPGYHIPVSSEDFPILSTYTQPNAPPEATPAQSDEQKNQLPRGGVNFSSKDSNDFIKNMTDRMISLVQERQIGNDVSKDWDSVYHALIIVKTVLKSIE